MSLFKSFSVDLKTYYKVHKIYPKLYKSSVIKSYIVNEHILGNELIIKEGVKISNTLQKIGNYTYIGDNTNILNCESIGNYCSISHDVKIGLENHKLHTIGTSPVFYSQSRKWINIAETTTHNKATIIESDVLISANALIMSGVKLSVGCVVGAGAFVNNDVPPYAIVVGAPARIIRYRFDDKIIERLLKSEWWEMDKATMLKYQDTFENVEMFLDKIEAEQK